MLMLLAACTWIDELAFEARLADGAVDCVPTAEVWYDGFDQDCDGANDYDQDGDGHVPPAYATLVVDLPADDCWDDPAVLGDNEALAGFDQPTPDRVYPGADEAWYDGVDQDCAGDDDFDQDGDGHASATWPSATGPGDDCFDAAGDTFTNEGGLDPAEVYPDADDAWYDGTDADCAGDDDFDQDGDSYPLAGDCDDLDPERYPDPTIVEVWYDGYDADCDFNDGDQDGDGYIISGYPYLFPDGYLTGDCYDDPADAADWGSLAPADVYPGAVETWYDSLDQDCRGGDDFDQDGDGQRSASEADETGAYGVDCDDTDAAVNTDAVEVWYDGVDQDCDGANDDDADGDGAEHDVDCDDSDRTRSPDFVEDCSTSWDDDCDGHTNTPDGLGSSTFYADSDGDGFGSDVSEELCAAEAPYVTADSTDCDDADGAVNPDADEDCATTVDDDCDGQDNEVGADNCVSWYPDGDGDTYGSDTPVCQCDATANYPADVGGDCDDTVAAVNPGEVEVCNSIDDDCVGGADDGLTLYYVDADLDGFGDENDAGDCATTGVEDNTDCDDSSAATYPAAPEMCDGAENDCDSTTPWAAGDEDALVASVTDDGVWSDLTTSFDDAVASIVTLGGGRTYYFCSGTYNTRLSASGVTVDIVGVYGAANTVLDSSTSVSAKETLSTNGGDVQVTGLTFTGGSGAGASPNQYGGGIFATASSASTPTLTLTECAIEGNTADYGGGLAVFTYAWVVLDGTRVGDNSATNGAGVHVSTTGMLEVTNGSYIEDNVASTHGGGIYITGSGDAEVDGSTIRRNEATMDGAAVYLTDGTLSLTGGALVVSNDGLDDGVIYVDDGTLSCSDSGIYTNSSTRGAVYLANYSSTTATFIASSCDFGSGGLDNSPYDVTVKATSSTYTNLTGYTSSETFTCTSVSDTCSPLP